MVRNGVCGVVVWGGGMWLTLLGRSFSVPLRDFARRRCRCSLVRTYGLLKRGCSRLRRADELPLLGVWWVRAVWSD